MILPFRQKSKRYKVIVGNESPNKVNLEDIFRIIFLASSQTMCYDLIRSVIC